jgi:glycogen operon protein
VLSQVKLIAEPWDVGEGGYQVGNFPPGWTEWNGKYRDGVRRYWKGDDGLIGELAYRLTGSSDLYQANGRLPYASVNFITAHDGFTLHDLVSYNHKHNEANLDDNRDGPDDNGSWNCGVEGPTDDPQVLKLRARQKRNQLATLLLSQGVPMLLAGDELGRTQQGNNNTYCQDNGLSWVHWAASDQELVAFTAAIVALRKAHPTFRRRKYFQGRGLHGQDLQWLTPLGADMTSENWADPFTKCFGALFTAAGFDEKNGYGEPITDDDFLLLLNAHYEPVDFVLPAPHAWETLVDTARMPVPGAPAEAQQTRYVIDGRSLVVLRRRVP